MLRPFRYKLWYNVFSVCRFSITTTSTPVKNSSQSLEEKLPSNNLENNIMESADTFGNYSEITSKLDMINDDPEDIKERKRQKEMDRQSRAYYIDVIKTHLNNHDYPKAVEVLEHRMLKVDKVRPDSYVYDLLVSYCGRTGNAPEAFRLYNQIKKRRYYVTGGQYTSLFNACANSRNSRKALEVAQKVRHYLSEDELHKANIKNYNAMLKAFGRHGDMKSSLEIMDEVIERRGRVKDDTYNFLLQACISDSNSGYRNALLIWHRLLQNKTDPSIFTFNLMLRATRDCKLGAPEHIDELIGIILKEGSSRSLRKLRVQEITPYSLPLPPMINNVTEVTCEESQHENKSQCHAGVGDSKENMILLKSDSLPFSSLREEVIHSLPNLLAIKPRMDLVIDLRSFSTAYHRLMLLGGAVGFLQVMDSMNVNPDMKTFTLLLDIIPSTKEAEEDLINLVKMKKVSFDTGFFNMLIKKRSYRFDYNGAKDVLKLMQDNCVQADLLTFGALALGCKKREDGEALLQSIREAGLRPNSEILGPLIRHATYQSDILYVRAIMKTMKEDNVKPSAKLMVLLSDFINNQKKLYQK